MIVVVVAWASYCSITFVNCDIHKTNCHVASNEMVGGYSCSRGVVVDSGLETTTTTTTKRRWEAASAV